MRALMLVVACAGLIACGGESARPDGGDPRDAIVDSRGDGWSADLPEPSDPGSDPDVPDPGPEAADAGTDVSPEAPPFRPVGWVRALEDVGSTGVYRTRVDLAFLAGPLPTSQQVVAVDGDCTLLVGALSGFCNPPCQDGTTCLDSSCVPFPAPAPCGQITLQGLTAPLTLDPDPQGAYAVPGLPADLFVAGAAVRATSAGGATPAFDLVAAGVPDLETTVDDTPFEPGQPYVVAWTAPAQPVAGARIRLRLETGWHGSPNLTTLWCETDDDGSLTVPAALTAQVPVPSCGKCVPSTLARFTRDQVDVGAGPVVLEVASEWTFIPWW